MFKTATKSAETTKPPSVVNDGDATVVQGDFLNVSPFSFSYSSYPIRACWSPSLDVGNAGTFKFEMAPVSSGSTSRKRALRSGTSQAEKSAGPSKRVRLDECMSTSYSLVMMTVHSENSFSFIASTWSAGTVVPSSSSNGNRIPTNGKSSPDDG